MSSTEDDGQTIFPASTVKTVGGVKVGFIGLTLEGTPNIVSAAGIASVDFLDEATTINAAADDLRSQGVKTIVVLLHEGGRAVGVPESEHDRHLHRHLRRHR